MGGGDSECDSATDCDDSSDCTADRCDSGSCVHDLDEGLCSDAVNTCLSEILTIEPYQGCAPGQSTDAADICTDTTCTGGDTMGCDVNMTFGAPTAETSVNGDTRTTIYNQNWSEQHHGLKIIARKDSARGRGRGTDAVSGNGNGDGGVSPDSLSAEDSVRFEIKVPTNAELAENLKGKLLLVHGDMDNNVHPGNTIRLVNALTARTPFGRACARSGERTSARTSTPSRASRRAMALPT
jgi:hypothetical protein